MLSEQDIEAGLSYAWLHLIASRAGFSCAASQCSVDNVGVDATIREHGRRLSHDSMLTSFAVDIQLKATRRELPEDTERDHFSFVLSVVPHYNQLRSAQGLPRFLVVLRLPSSAEEWLQVTDEGLIAR